LKLFFRTVTILAPTLSDLAAVAREMLKRYPDQRVFAFYGSMGAGKTTFIKAICKELGVEGPTSSPSFSIVNEYKGAGGIKLYHFDFYRLKSEAEASDIGLEEYLDSGHYCFMEWPERIEGLLPPNHLKINIKESETGRHISFSSCP